MTSHLLMYQQRNAWDSVLVPNVCGWTDSYMASSTEVTIVILETALIKTY